MANPYLILGRVRGGLILGEGIEGQERELWNSHPNPPSQTKKGGFRGGSLDGHPNPPVQAEKGGLGQNTLLRRKKGFTKAQNRSSQKFTRIHAYSFDCHTFSRIFIRLSHFFTLPFLHPRLEKALHECFARSNT